jgi:hypothetical protein
VAGRVVVVLLQIETNRWHFLENGDCGLSLLAISMIIRWLQRKRENLPLPAWRDSGSMRPIFQGGIGASLIKLLKCAFQVILAHAGQFFEIGFFIRIIRVSPAGPRK